GRGPGDLHGRRRHRRGRPPEGHSRDAANRPAAAVPAPDARPPVINAPHSVLGLLEPLLLAAVNTVRISAGAFVVAVTLGLALASLRHLVRARALRIGIQVYVEIFRNVPSLTHLFILYYGLAYAGLRLGSMTAAILGLGLIGAASLSEVYRAGLQ